MYINKLLGSIELHNIIKKTSYLEINKFLKEREFFLSGNVYAYIMIREHSIDIDEKIDMEFARILASRNS